MPVDAPQIPSQLNEPTIIGRAWDHFLYETTDDTGEMLLACAVWTTPIALLLTGRGRGLGALGLAVLLSRAHAHARRQVEDLVTSLFDERTAVGAKVVQLERRLRALGQGQADRLDGIAGSLNHTTGRVTRLEQQWRLAGAVPVAPDPDNDCGASG